MTRMTMRLAIAICLFQLTGYGDVSQFDERIAADRSQVDVEGLEWVDGASLQLESRGFANTPSPYARMPADLLPSCPEGVRAMSAQSTGHYFLFETDSNKLAVEWVLQESRDAIRLSRRRECTESTSTTRLMGRGVSCATDGFPRSITPRIASTFRCR